MNRGGFGLVCWWMSLATLSCGSSGPVPQSGAARLDESCLNACAGVQRIPTCPREALAEPTLSVAEATAALDELVGQVVRVRGQLLKAEVSSTQIDCPTGTCCSELLNPSLALGELHLDGQYQLPGGQVGALRCAARAGMMDQSLASSPDERFFFEPWDRAKRGDPPHHRLQRAYCCSLDAHGQQVVVSATLAPPKHDDAPARLSDPFLCSLPGPEPKNLERR